MANAGFVAAYYSYNINTNVGTTTSPSLCTAVTSPETVIDFNETMITTLTDGDEWSVQMNAHTTNSTVGLMQFDMADDAGDVYGSVEYWPVSGPKLFNHDLSTLAVTGHVAAGDFFDITPLVNSNGDVAEVYFEYYSSVYNTAYSYTYTIPSTYLVPIDGWVVNIVKENNGGNVVFTSGGGQIVYSTGGTTTNSDDTPSCWTSGATTSETSNMDYGSPTSSSGDLDQGFYWGNIDVVSEYAQGGTLLKGYYTTLSLDGNTVDSGFTPESYAHLTQDDTYTVQVSNYAPCVFDHWNNTLSTDNEISVDVSSTPVMLYPMYNCGNSSGILDLEVDSENSEYGSISGYYVVLSQYGSTVATGFTTTTFNSLVENTYYTVQADSYESCTFSYWVLPNGGTVTSDPYTYLLSYDQELTAIYDCT